jgi:hypothetical protein
MKLLVRPNVTYKVFREGIYSEKVYWIKFEESHHVIEFCLNLALLRFHLIDAISIPVKDGPNLQIKVNEKIRQKRGHFSEKPALIELTISQEELEYWLMFFLEYYRDGVGSVDHIDVEITEREQSSPPKSLQIALIVPKAKPPISWNQALEILNLPNE